MARKLTILDCSGTSRANATCTECAIAPNFNRSRWHSPLPTDTPCVVLSRLGFYGDCTAGSLSMFKVGNAVWRSEPREALRRY